MPGRTGSERSAVHGGMAARWTPVGLYVLLILIVSSIPHLQVPGFKGSDKIAHFSEYGILGLLARRAASYRGARGWLIAIAAVALVGALDEIYQRTVPGRSSSPFDWMADTLGGIVGSAVWMVLPKVSAGRGARRGRTGEAS